MQLNQKVYKIRKISHILMQKFKLPKSNQREMKRIKSNRDFNWKTSINTMLIIEINTINIKSLQATLTSFSHIAWITTDFKFPISSSNSKLSSQFNLLSYTFQSLYKKFTIIYNLIHAHITSCNKNQIKISK